MGPRAGIVPGTAFSPNRLWPIMGLKTGPFRLRSDFKRMQEVARELKEDRERAGEEAALAASKSAKDTGASTEEAASLVEAARDSAVDEVKKDQSQMGLIILGLVILFLYYMST